MLLFANEIRGRFFREESALTVFGIRTQSLAAPYHRSTRELHHPGKTFFATIPGEERIYAGPAAQNL
jgi:hypothetical protein